MLGSLSHGGKQLVSLDESPCCVGIAEAAVDALSARCNELMAEKVGPGVKCLACVGILLPLFSFLPFILSSIIIYIVYTYHIKTTPKSPKSYQNHHQVRRAERLKGLGDQIAELWDRLKVPDAEREAFSASVDGGCGCL